MSKRPDRLLSNLVGKTPPGNMPAESRPPLSKRAQRRRDERTKRRGVS